MCLRWHQGRYVGENAGHEYGDWRLWRLSKDPCERSQTMHRLEKETSNEKRAVGSRDRPHSSRFVLRSRLYC